MVDDIPINWQKINLEEDDASAQGTRALRFMIERIHQAQHKSKFTTNFTISL